MAEGSRRCLLGTRARPRQALDHRDWAVAAIVAEIGGSLLTILGLGGPIGPGLLFRDMLIVTLVFHWPQGFWVAGDKAGIEFPIP